MGGTFFLLHIFRMSLFFFIAGLFARLSLEKRGTRGFVIDRLKRVGVPLVAGWPILFALIIAVAVWASLRATGKIPSPPPMPDNPGIFSPLTHLWFLYVLLWLYALALGVRWVVQQLDRGGALRARIDRNTVTAYLETGSVGLAGKQPAQGPQERRLAAAVRADHGGDGAVEPSRSRPSTTTLSP